jgi:hypothetical protein
MKILVIKKVIAGFYQSDSNETFMWGKNLKIFSKENHCLEKPWCMIM